MTSINLSVQTAQAKKDAELRVKSPAESYFEVEEAWGTKRDFAYIYIYDGTNNVNVRANADELAKMEDAIRAVRFKLEVKAAKQAAVANPW